MYMPFTERYREKNTGLTVRVEGNMTTSSMDVLSCRWFRRGEKKNKKQERYLRSICIRLVFKSEVDELALGGCVDFSLETRAKILKNIKAGRRKNIHRAD